MFSIFRRIFANISNKNKKNVLYLQILIFFSSVFEIIGIGGIGPLTAMVVEEDIIFENQYLLYLYNYFNITDTKIFIYFFGISICVIYLVSNILIATTVYLSATVSNQIEREFAVKLYEQYIRQNYLITINKNSSEMIKNIINELNRVSQSILIPILEINAKVPTVLGIGISLVYSININLYFPILITAFLYLLIYFSIKKSLTIIDNNISNSVNSEIKLLNESLGSIREVKLLNRYDIFVNQFQQQANKLAHSKTTGLIYSRLPRYFIETLLFISGSIFLIFISFNNKEIISFLPSIALATAGFYKLLPAINSIFHQSSFLKFNLEAYSKVEEDLTEFNNYSKSNINNVTSTNSKIDLNLEKTFKSGTVYFKNIAFKYPKSEVAYKNLNFEIPLNKITCFIGKSGSGKSTTLDILTGLIDQSDGEIMLDKTCIGDFIDVWQKQISYVPQNSILIDDTILNNIIFYNKVEKDVINNEKLNKILDITKINDFLQDLPDGINTSIGEKGLKISGGQKQRIALARALFKSPKILILDEATNAIDDITEKMILKNITESYDKLTIIICTHKKKTLKSADNILLFNNNNVTTFVDFETLIKSDLYQTIFTKDNDYE